jgi:molybdenum cofactor guanylyltransferase
MPPQVSGYVLAGGESSRMGADKALLRFGGETLLERALRKVNEVCGNAAILGGPAERCARFHPYGRVVADRVVGCGPLGGLDAALADAVEDWVLVVPVDLPLLPTIALEDLVWFTSSDSRGSVHCYMDGGVTQPLPVLLHKSMSNGISAALRDRELKLAPVLRRIGEQNYGMREMKALRLRDYDWFTNVNTPEEFGGLGV